MDTFSLASQNPYTHETRTVITTERGTIGTIQFYTQIGFTLDCVDLSETAGVEKKTPLVRQNGWKTRSVIITPGRLSNNNVLYDVVFN